MWDYQAVIHSVHDGDTVRLTIDQGFCQHLGPVWARMDGINAPELLQSRTIAGREVSGEDATLHLLDLLGGRALFADKRTRSVFGRPGDYLALAPIPCRVRTRLEKGQDDFEKYGRVLARLTVPWPESGPVVDLSSAMLADGYALPSGNLTALQE